MEQTMDWKQGDWMIFDLRICQIKKIGEYDEVSDGSIGTSGRLRDRYRPLTLRNKCIIEYFDYYYRDLSKIDGERGFNWPDISRHFNELALEAIDSLDDEGVKAAYNKATEFVAGAREHKTVIQGVRLFRKAA